MEEQHVGMALGGAMGVACWEVIRYHIKNPYHFSFQRHYLKCVFGVHPVLSAPEVRPPACKLLGFPAVKWQISQTQLIALKHSLSLVQPKHCTKRAKTKHHYYNFTSVSSLLKCSYHALIHTRLYMCAAEAHMQLCIIILTVQPTSM